MQRLAPWFWALCLASCTAVAAFHYERFDVVVLARSAQLAALGVIVALETRGRAPTDAGELWSVHVPFSAALAWSLILLVCSATHLLELNQASLAYRQPVAWAVLMLSLVTLTAGVFAWFRRDPVVLGVTMWAVIGMVVRSGIPSPVATTGLGAAVILSAILVYVVHANHGRIARQQPTRA